MVGAPPPRGPAVTRGEELRTQAALALFVAACWAGAGVVRVGLAVARWVDGARGGVWE